MVPSSRLLKLIRSILPFLITFIILNSVIQGVSASEEDVHTIQYTVDNFADEIPKKHHFVMFYAPWCGHCQRLHPTWEQLAEMLNEDDSNIKIAKVDCTTDGKVCSDQDITGYPTLKFFRVGEDKGVRFRGTRDLPTLTNFINEQVRQVDDTEDNIKLPQYSSTLKELNEKNFDQVTSKGKHFVKFYAPWCGHCQKLAPVWEDLAKAMEFNKAISIGKIDCTDNRDICNKFDVKGYPTLLWLEDGQKVGKYQGDRSIDGLKEYVNKMSSGSETEDELNRLRRENEINSSKKAEEVSGVLELNSENFNENVQKGITFVEFFSPWCGHCKRLAPTWEDLGKKFSEKHGVNIAKVDCTADGNREFCNEKEIEGFPSLFIYKDGTKQSEYTGTRSLEDLVNFVNQHAVHDEL